MSNSADYYQALGVTRDAEQVVITAAYRALASIYHPDRWKGDVNESTRRMAEINVAYAVLGDHAKRQAYDAAHQSSTTNMGPDAETVEQAFVDALGELESRWQTAVDVLPDLAQIRKRLSKIAHRLAFEFVVLMIDSKKFDQRAAIADALEKRFLEAHFGTQPDIIKYAKNLIQDGNREAIKALNNYVDVLGTGLDPKLIIKKVRDQFNLDRYKQQQEDKQRIEILKREITEHEYFDAAKELAHLSGFAVFSVGNGIFAPTTWDIYRKNSNDEPYDDPVLEKVSAGKLIKWVKENIC